jgi:hypothetical protein
MLKRYIVATEVFHNWPEMASVGFICKHFYLKGNLSQICSSIFEDLEIDGLMTYIIASEVRHQFLGAA